MYIKFKINFYSYPQFHKYKQQITKILMHKNIFQSDDITCNCFPPTLTNRQSGLKPSRNMTTTLNPSINFHRITKSTQSKSHKQQYSKIRTSLRRDKPKTPNHSRTQIQPILNKNQSNQTYNIHNNTYNTNNPYHINNNNHTNQYILIKQQNNNDAILKWNNNNNNNKVLGNNVKLLDDGQGKNNIHYGNNSNSINMNNINNQVKRIRNNNINIKQNYQQFNTDYNVLRQQEIHMMQQKSSIRDLKQTKNQTIPIPVSAPVPVSLRKYVNIVYENPQHNIHNVQSTNYIHNKNNMQNTQNVQNVQGRQNIQELKQPHHTISFKNQYYQPNTPKMENQSKNWMNLNMMGINQQQQEQQRIVIQSPPPYPQHQHIQHQSNNNPNHPIHHSQHNTHSQHSSNNTHNNNHPKKLSLSTKPQKKQRKSLTAHQQRMILKQIQSIIDQNDIDYIDDNISQVIGRGWQKQRKQQQQYYIYQSKMYRDNQHNNNNKDIYVYIDRQYNNGNKQYDNNNDRLKTQTYATGLSNIKNSSIIFQRK